MSKWFIIGLLLVVVVLSGCLEKQLSAGLAGKTGYDYNSSDLLLTKGDFPDQTDLEYTGPESPCASTDLESHCSADFEKSMRPLPEEQTQFGFTPTINHLVYVFTGQGGVSEATAKFLNEKNIYEKSNASIITYTKDFFDEGFAARKVDEAQRFSEIIVLRKDNVFEVLSFVFSVVNHPPTKIQWGKVEALREALVEKTIQKIKGANKYTCLNKERTDDPKKCKEYCESADKCSLEKVEAKPCFGVLDCIQNKCVWKCEENYSALTAKEIALSLEELVEQGYSQVGKVADTNNESISNYKSTFENAREKIVFIQDIATYKKATKKVDTVNNFNGLVNELAKKETGELSGLSFGEDSLTTKIPASEIKIPSDVNFSYENTYVLLFRKMNFIVTLTVNTESDENATKFFNKYGKTLESRIS